MDKDKVQKELIFELVIFLLALILVLVFFAKTLLLTIFLLAGWIVALKFWHKDHDVYFFLFGAIVATLTDILYVMTGIWEYTKPDFFGIPMWVPLIGGYITMIIKRHAEIYLDISMKYHATPDYTQSSIPAQEPVVTQSFQPKEPVQKEEIHNDETRAAESKAVAAPKTEVKKTRKKK